MGSGHIIGAQLFAALPQRGMRPATLIHSSYTKQFLNWRSVVGAPHDTPPTSQILSTQLASKPLERKCKQVWTRRRLSSRSKFVVPSLMRGHPPGGKPPGDATAIRDARTYLKLASTRPRESRWGVKSTIEPKPRTASGCEPIDSRKAAFTLSNPSAVGVIKKR